MPARRPVVATFSALAAAAVLAGGTAWVGALWVEDRSRDTVASALTREGADWATVETDGLRLVLGGTAPDERARLRAITAAGRQVDPARVIDAIAVARAAEPAAPRYSLEILRNASGISLIGLVPASDGPAVLERGLRGFDDVTDMVETADRAVPSDQKAAWDAALGYALDVLGDLPQAKVSVTPGAVEISAITDSDADRRTLEATLDRAVPDGVALTRDVAAPRPVVAPFTTRFVVEEDGARFEACAAGTGAAVAEMTEAARSAGMTGEADCVVALGAPSATWGEAVTRGIETVASLGGGSVTFSDADVTLVGPEGVDAETFETVAADFDAALPDIYVLTSIRPEPEISDADAVRLGIPEFTATRAEDGTVAMRGRVRDAAQEQAIAAYGRAMLGPGAEAIAATRDADLPQGWPVRVLAGIEALSRLETGRVTVRPDRVTLTGVTGLQRAEAVITGLLSDKLGADGDFRIDVTYDERLDPTLAIPTPEQCIERLAQVQEVAKLSFAPGEAVIDASSAETLGQLVDVLRDCRREVFEVEGHTDSQGREIMNLELSQARADAVRAAMIERGIAPSQLIAQGYGETLPIADNGTAAGREQNRRITFTLVTADTPVAEGAADGAGAEAQTPEDG